MSSLVFKTPKTSSDPLNNRYQNTYISWKAFVSVYLEMFSHGVDFCLRCYFDESITQRDDASLMVHGIFSYQLIEIVYHSIIYARIQTDFLPYLLEIISQWRSTIERIATRLVFLVTISPWDCLCEILKSVMVWQLHITLIFWRAFI